MKGIVHLGNAVYSVAQGGRIDINLVLKWKPTTGLSSRDGYARPILYSERAASSQICYGSALMHSLWPSLNHKILLFLSKGVKDFIESVVQH